MKINFKEVLVIGSLGVFLIIVAEILQIRILSILGIINLAIVFIINSRMLLKRIEKLESNCQQE